MSAAYLIDHPPASRQFRAPRREAPSGVIVIHTAENTPDFVAFDGGAEAVAHFIATRPDPGSYHELVDSGGPILLVPYDWEAFHDATGGNPHELSISVATRADIWPLAPKAWRDGAVEQAAQAANRQARWVHTETGIVIPAQRITRDESERRVPGFISHAQRDPTRRTDPGKDFPWTQFLARYAELTADLGNHQEDDDMADPAVLAQLDTIQILATQAADKSAANEEALERLKKRVGTDNTGRDLADEMDAVIKAIRILLTDGGHDPKDIGL